MEIHPCVLQDIGPLGPLPCSLFFSWSLRAGYHWPCAILGWLVITAPTHSHASLVAVYPLTIIYFAFFSCTMGPLTDNFWLCTMLNHFITVHKMAMSHESSLCLTWLIFFIFNVLVKGAISYEWHDLYFFCNKKPKSEPNLLNDCTAQKLSIDHTLKVYVGEYCRFSNRKKCACRSIK